MKTWFITGTSSGFGRGMTEQLLERGDRVIATARRPDALDDLRSRHDDEHLTVVELDVTEPAAVERVVDDAFDRAGRIDVVVNNAGRGIYAAVEEATRDQITGALATNLLGPIDVIRAALPHLRAQRGGRIMQVSSAGGQVAYAGFGYYHAAKWGIEGLCEALAIEVAPFGIGVTLVEPGATPTGFGSGKDLNLTMPEYDTGRFGTTRQQMRDGTRTGPNDPRAIVRAIIASADSDRVPLRLPLGVDAYHDIHEAYEQRMQELEQAKDTALSVGDENADRLV